MFKTFKFDPNFVPKKMWMDDKYLTLKKEVNTLLSDAKRCQFKNNLINKAYYDRKKSLLKLKTFKIIDCKRRVTEAFALAKDAAQF